MKSLKISFFIVFIFAQLFFIFFKIYHHSHLIQLSFAKQKLEDERARCLEQKKYLNQELSKLQNRSHIKKQAAQQYGLEKIRLSNIKKLYDK